MPVRIALVLLAAAFFASSTMMCVSARYLPTRSQEDRLEKLRELLKDVSVFHLLSLEIIMPIRRQISTIIIETTELH